jgi:hypothetical protein
VDFKPNHIARVNVNRIQIGRISNLIRCGDQLSSTRSGPDLRYRSRRHNIDACMRAVATARI